ncbi:MAG TPA: ComEA family DNA-binding protein [Gaiellaceae bacterium]|nr:ComEA family DNA-binding protein [Gaiellaceae bacterium]
MYELVLTRRRVLTGVLVAVVVLLLAARFLLHGPAASTKLERPIVGSAEAGAAPGVGGAAAPASSPSRPVVYVVGAVRRPGLYRLPAGSRVADAVSRAGGLTRKADPAGVNLAAPVADGEQLVVPARLPVEVAGAQGAPLPGAASAPAGPVQLSVATVEQLDSLPGIGPVTAQKIVDYRTAHGAFRSVDELDEVPGIGPARVEQLRGLVVP